jgi:hypothetical protein
LHQARQHLAPVEEGNSIADGREVFGIAPIDRRADDHGVRVAYISRLVTDRYPNALATELLD